MKISIEYCGSWNYLPRASSLAALLTERIHVAPELIRGDGGVFDVVVDGELIFSKHDEGRFPEEDEILAALGARW